MPTKYSHVGLRHGCPHETCSHANVTPPNWSGNSPGIMAPHASNNFEPAGCSTTPPNRRADAKAAGPQSLSRPSCKCRIGPHGPQGGCATTGFGPAYRRECLGSSLKPPRKVLHQCSHAFDAVALSPSDTGPARQPLNNLAFHGLSFPGAAGSFGSSDSSCSATHLRMRTQRAAGVS